jgi:hypothetical protein
MVNAHEAQLIKNIHIPYELDNIRYYALEIGFYKKLLEGKMAESHDDIKQWYNYFLTYAEIELEAANERIKEYHQQLDNYDQR